MLKAVPGRAVMRQYGPKRKNPMHEPDPNLTNMNDTESLSVTAAFSNSIHLSDFKYENNIIDWVFDAYNFFSQVF